MRFDTTICAPACAPGGAISLIRVSGENALEIVDSIFKPASAEASPLASAQGWTLHYGNIMDGDSVLDDVVVSVFKAPHSYTGENMAEISCHASSYIVSRLLELLVSCGAQTALPGEFTKRAFVNGKMDLAQAEAVADVIAASGEASLRVAQTQLRGGISRKLADMRSELLEITSLLELELDFSEEDVEFADRSRLSNLVDTSISHISALADSFKLGNAIKNGVPVAIVGNTNTGKSTLLNALLGDDRAIVTDIPGTTRDTVEELFNLGGINFRFIDTAGIRSTTDKVEKIGIERSLKAISEASIVIGLVDATIVPDKFVKEAKEIVSRITEGQTLLLYRSKVDLFDLIYPEEYPAFDRSYGVFEQRYSAFGTWKQTESDLTEMTGYPVKDLSAVSGYGMDELREALIAAVSGSGSAKVSADDVLISNARHHEALVSALQSLRRVATGLSSALAPDLVAQDLRDALYHLGTITGEISTDEVLGNIFRNFCIGK